MTTVTRPTVQFVLTRKILLWILGILLGFSIASLPQYLRIKKSAQWPSVPGVITTSFVQSRPCKYPPCISGEIGYRYKVGSTEYLGTAFNLNRRHDATQEAWQKVIDRYPIGKAVNVYYEAGNPANAVLEPGLIGETELLYKMVVGMIWFFGLSFAAALAWYRDPEVSVARLSVSPHEKL